VAIQSEFRNETSLLLYIDTHIIDATDDDAAFLRQLHETGWIQLQRTDTLDTELGKLGDPEKRDELLGLSDQYVESFGPLVLDHSRWDHAVLASDEDADRLARVRDLLYGTAITPRDNDFRDAMHVATAIRYGAFGFVTMDKRILRRDPAIREAFQGFRLLAPAAAKAEALDRVRRARVVNAARDNPRDLPAWPSTDK
jgi:hypothetical protein